MPAEALKQVPSRFRRKIMVRVDGAGAGRELVKHPLSLSSKRKTVLFTAGWMITAADEDATREIPAGAWKPGACAVGAGAHPGPLGAPRTPRPEPKRT